MAYRFNPPPNWPIDDASWSPPPGWQPDPSWGPAPEGWNFWVTSEADGEPTADPDVASVPAPVEDVEAVEGQGAPETDEYPGPDLEADLAQAAPYESAQPSPQDQGYEQAYPSGYASAPGDGQSPVEGLPSASSGDGWTATTASGGTPTKGILARFWWVGCIVLFLVAALAVAVVGGILLFGGDRDAGEDGESTASAEQSATEDEATTAEEGSEPASPEPTTPLPTIESSAESKPVTGQNGSGDVAVQMEWKKAEDLPSTYGGTVEPAENGEYLVVTAEVTVTEGSMDFANYGFSVKTPYGGSVDSATETYALDESGLDYDTSYEFTEGETYTITQLFDVVKADGNTLQYNNYVDVYTWDVPA